MRMKTLNLFDNNLILSLDIVKLKSIKEVINLHNSGFLTNHVLFDNIVFKALKIYILYILKT